MLSSIRKAVRLTLSQPRRAWLMAQVAGWALVLSYAVRFRSLPSALRLLSVQPGPRKAAIEPEQLSTAVDAVLGMNVFAFRPTCWKRAILLHHFLGREGQATTIIFGLRIEPGGELKGHAWLEADGRVILEKQEPNYKVTYTFPSDDECNVDLANIVN